MDIRLGPVTQIVQGGKTYNFKLQKGGKFVGFNNAKKAPAWMAAMLNDMLSTPEERRVLIANMKMEHSRLERVYDEADRNAMGLRGQLDEQLTRRANSARKMEELTQLMEMLK